jgi:DNA-directed RNA polymerase subunit beta
MKPIKTKHFGKTKVSLNVPYLLSVPEADWKGFWEVDLQELLEEASPITDYTGEKFKLEFLDYKLEKPKYLTDLEAKRNNDSFEASLRVKVKLTNLRNKDITEQEIFFADFPLMTERGTFVVNGVERVVISQLIRSPGAFFTSKISRGKEMFGAKIIPNRGAWLEFETESTGAIYVRIDRKRKIAVTALLRAFGINDVDSMKNFFTDINKGEIDFIEETLKKDPASNQAEALVEVYQRIRPGDRATADSAKELIDNMFFNFKRYDLSKVGRWRMRQRLAELKPKKEKGDIPPEERVLDIEDIIAVMREIIRLNNDPTATPDQIDHLGNRRVRTFSELLKNRLRVGLMRMERIIKDKMSTIDIEDIDFAQLVNARPFAASIQQFFNSSQFSQFMDNENPLSELEQKRRLTASGPGGLTRERAGFEVRDVQPSHYGRICPIQTPEGPNVGLVGHIASYARINPFGFLETPYFKVEKGVIDGKKPFYLNAYEEEKHIISAGNVEVDKDNKIVPSKLEARVNGVPKLVSKNDVDFIDVSSEQFISVATSCVPFLQNDDANRALMGSNMQRQAVPLVEPDAPLVMTGMEAKVCSDSGQSVVADFDGTIEEIDGSHIVLKGTGKDKKVYNLRTFIGTNQYTCLHQRPIV